MPPFDLERWDVHMKDEFTPDDGIVSAFTVKIENVKIKMEAEFEQLAYYLCRAARMHTLVISNVKILKGGISFIERLSMNFFNNKLKAMRNLRLVYASGEAFSRMGLSTWQTIFPQLECLQYDGCHESDDIDQVLSEPWQWSLRELTLPFCQVKHKGEIDKLLLGSQSHILDNVLRKVTILCGHVSSRTETAMALNLALKWRKRDLPVDVIILLRQRYLVSETTLAKYCGAGGRLALDFERGFAVPRPVLMGMTQYQKYWACVYLCDMWMSTKGTNGTLVRRVGVPIDLVRKLMTFL